MNRGKGVAASNTWFHFEGRIDKENFGECKKQLSLHKIRKDGVLLCNVSGSELQCFNIV